jgi:hypothetical protein
MKEAFILRRKLNWLLTRVVEAYPLDPFLTAGDE